MCLGETLGVPLEFSNGEALGSDEGIILGSIYDEVICFKLGAADVLSIGIDERVNLVSLG